MTIEATTPSGEREVTLLTPRGVNETRAIRFWWDARADRWLSLPVAGARRMNGMKWYARRLEVRGRQLTSGPLDLRTTICAAPGTIEVWWDQVPAQYQARIDNDYGIDPVAQRAREAERERLDGRFGEVRIIALESSCSFGDLVGREAWLRRLLGPGEPSSTESDLWRRGVSSGLVDRDEAEAARHISANRDPLRWNCA